MKKFILFLIIIGFTSPVYSQVRLFNNYLKPANPKLVSELSKYQTLGSQLDAKIEALRDKAYVTAAPHEAKVDLAAFILRKLTLRKHLPFEDNEYLMYEAADLVPGNPHMETVWGDLLYFSGNYEDALTHYENALYEMQGNPQLTAKCGLAALQLMKYNEALDYFNRALKQHPDSFFLLFSAGKCNYELQYYYEAIDFWEKALANADNENQKQAVKNAIMSAKELLASTDGSTRDENQRFVIHFAGSSEDDLGDVAFDTLDDIFYDVTDLLQFNPDVKINVVFFLTEEYYKINKNWSAGAAQGIQIMVPLKSGYKSEDYVRGLLAHEFTHTIIHLKTNNRCPLWLNEGIAQYSEFAAANGSPEEMRYDYTSIYENEFIEKQDFFKLNDIHRYMRGSNRRNISKAYIASYLAVRCIADYYGDYTFDTILTELGEGKSIDEAMLEATGNDMADFQLEYEEWLRNL
jgi:tetratricopeptide (TPR) repeat protein